MTGEDLSEWSGQMLNAQIRSFEHEIALRRPSERPHLETRLAELRGERARRSVLIRQRHLDRCRRSSARRVQ